MITIT